MLPGARTDMRLELGHVGLRRAAAVASQRHLEQRLGGRAVDADAPVRQQVGAHGGERQQEGRGEAVPVLLGLQPVRVKVLRGTRAVGPGVPAPGSCAARARRARPAGSAVTVATGPRTAKHRRARHSSKEASARRGAASSCAAHVLHWPGCILCVELRTCSPRQRGSSPIMAALLTHSNSQSRPPDHMM